MDLTGNQFFMASQMPTLGGDMIINPNSKLDDGVINVQIVDHANAFAFTKLLLDVETGDHLNGNTVRVMDCVALRLEPKDGLVVVDGELVEMEPIQMQIHTTYQIQHTTCKIQNTTHELQNTTYEIQHDKNKRYTI